MTLRVNPDWTPNLLAALEQTRRQEDRALAQLASGRRVHSLSEDPPAATAAVGNRIQIGETDQFLRNLSSLRGLLRVTDSALNEVILALTRAISLGVQGANGTLSAGNRLAVAEEVRGVEQQLVNLANLSFHGSYVFAGTAVTNTPFVADPSLPSGMRYQGNTTVNVMEVAPGQTIAVQLPGTQIFSEPGADVFLALRNLVTALESGSGDEVAAATVELRKAFDHVNAQRAVFGNALAYLDSTESFLNREKLELSQRQNDLIAADPAVSATDLVQATEARNAVLAASGRISRLNLLDFLR